MEHYENFGGKRFRKMHTCGTKTMADQRKMALMRNGHYARVEQEGRRKWHVYARKKR